MENNNTKLQKALFIYVGQHDMDYTLAGKRDYGMKREPQIGFAYLGAILRQHKVDFNILDFTIKPYSKEDLTEYIKEYQPIFVGFYAATAIKDNLIGYIKFLRQKFPNLKILVGGPDLYECKLYIEAGADAYCIGEGELTIVDLLDYCHVKRKLADIKGIAYKEEGEIKITQGRELIADLNTLPIPAWDKFDLNNYYDFHVFDVKTPYVSIMTSRGCPFRCTYCISHKIWQGKYRKRSVESVMKEIDFLVEKCGVKYLTFQDDIWGWMDDNWAKEVCHELIKRKEKYDLKWRCILHPLSFLKSRHEILPLMREAGCTSITTGLQTASKQILLNIHRSPLEPDALAELIGIMKKVGILNNTAFIFGLPGDTEETMEESIKYALKLKPTFVAFYALSVLPGSDIWIMRKEGKFQSLPEEVIRKKCKEGSRRFHTNPIVLFNMFKSILKANPMWFFTAFKHFGYLLALTGIFQTRTKITID